MRVFQARLPLITKEMNVSGVKSTLIRWTLQSTILMKANLSSPKNSRAQLCNAASPVLKVCVSIRECMLMCM